MDGPLPSWIWPTALTGMFALIAFWLARGPRRPGDYEGRVVAVVAWLGAIILALVAWLGWALLWRGG